MNSQITETFSHRPSFVNFKNGDIQAWTLKEGWMGKNEQYANESYFNKKSNFSWAGLFCGN